MSFQFLKKGLVAALILPLAITAQAGKDVKQPVAAESTPILSGEFNITVISEYISYGIVAIDRDVNIQPSLNLALSLYRGDGFINNVSVIGGAWGEIWQGNNASKNGASNNPKELLEVDYNAGVSVQFAKNFNLAVSHIWFNSPSGDFHTARALNATLSYDDSDLLGALALKPHFTYLHELSGKVANGATNRKGNFFELGIQPALPSIGCVALSLPVNVAFGNHNFYEGRAANLGDNTHFGYVSVGALAEVPLSFIPSYLGDWKFNASATYYRLNKHNYQSYFYSSDRVVYAGGLSISF